jgi:hypothetical protein
MEVGMDTVVTLSIRDPGATPEQLEVLSGMLREELLALNVANVRPALAGVTPDGALAVDAPADNGMLLSVPETAPLLAALLDVVSHWLTRTPGRTVLFAHEDETLEFTQVAPEEDARMIYDWVHRRIED